VRAEAELRGDQLIVTRWLDATPEHVWAAFTTPEHLAGFWGGDHAQVPADTVHIDLRVGGRFELLTVGPGGAEHLLRFTYDEVDRPRRLAFTEPLTGIATRVDLIGEDDGTRITVHQRRLPPELQTHHAEAGLAAIVDRLAELIAHH
jgi:uncharacterized protein YndB with AHSA1/START domain